MSKSKDLGQGFKILLFILRIWQKVFVRGERLFQPLFALPFRLCGITYTVVVRDGKETDKLEKPLEQLQEIFRDAIEINIALGEMGQKQP